MQQPPGEDGGPSRTDGGAASEPEPELGCLGELSLRTGPFDVDRGAPVAAFARGDEDWIFFDSCTLLQLDAKTGEVRRESRICQGYRELAVTTSDGEFWLAGSRDQTDSQGRTYAALDVIHVSASGANLGVYTARTNGEIYSITVAAGPAAVVVVAVEASRATVPIRQVYRVVKANFPPTESAEPIFLDGTSSDFLAFVDRVRPVDRGFEGFTLDGRKISIDANGGVASAPGGAVYPGKGSCSVGRGMFPMPSVFLPNDVAFVGLTVPLDGYCHVYPWVAPEGTRYAAVSRRLTSGAVEELDSFTRQGEELEDLFLCNASPVEASVFSRFRRGGAQPVWTFSRYRYDRIPVPSYTLSDAVSTHPGTHPVKCPVAIRNGYLLGGIDDKTTWLSCK